jgi:hypothetical protein
VLFNTGSGLKYLDVLDANHVGQAPSPAQPAQSKKPATRQIGGIIGPY